MSRVIINVPVVHRQTREMTYRQVRGILREIRFLARSKVSHGPYTTGRLARSIDIDGPYVGPNVVRGSVGSDLEYAPIVEKGAGLYGPRRMKFLIRPIPPRKFLRFYWRKLGRTVYLERVRHPGQQGKHYLTDALREVARRHGLRVIIRE